MLILIKTSIYVMFQVKNQVEQILYFIVVVLYSPQNRENKWSHLWNYMGMFTADERWSSYLQSSGYDGKRFRIQAGMCNIHFSVDIYFYLSHFYIFSMQDLTIFIILIKKHLFNSQIQRTNWWPPNCVRGVKRWKD